MCELCDNIDNVLQLPRIELFKDGYSLVVGTYDNYYDSSVEVYFSINFCPECGKDLQESPNEE